MSSKVVFTIKPVKELRQLDASEQPKRLLNATQSNYKSTAGNFYWETVWFWPVRAAVSGELMEMLTLNVMKISFFPTGILTVWPSSTPKNKPDAHQGWE